MLLTCPSSSVRSDLKELPDLYDRREKACKKLESAETKLLKLATKQIAKNKKKNQSPPELDAEASKGEITRYVPKKKRPTHKLGMLGLFGKKVDTIDWAREEIATTTKELDAEREILLGGNGSAKYPPESSAFIQFHTQMAAHMFAQCVPSHRFQRVSFVVSRADSVLPRSLSQVPQPPRAAPHVGSLPRGRAGRRHLGQPQHQPVPAARPLRHLVGHDDRPHHPVVVPRCAPLPLRSLSRSHELRADSVHDSQWLSSVSSRT